MIKKKEYIQVKRSLSDIELRSFIVFVSYKTEDYAIAEHVSSGLRNLGFSVAYLTPDSMASPIEQDELERRLGIGVLSADALCLIVSRKSLQSPWVQFEYKEAAHTIGRVVFVCADESLHAGDALLNYITPTQLIAVRHTTVTLLDMTSLGITILANELINDPEVGWFDGRQNKKPFYPSCGVDFQLESIRRRFARSYIMAAEHYRGRRILDVIPFAWEEIGVSSEDLTGAIRWAIFQCGRRGLEEALLRDELEIFYDTAPIEIWDKIFLKKLLGKAEHLIPNQIDMLVVCDAIVPGKKIGQLTNGKQAAAWSLRPEDMTSAGVFLGFRYNGLKIAGFAVRHRRNLPREEGLDMGEYGQVILQKDRPDLLARLRRGECECYMDNLCEQNYWILIVTVIENSQQLPVSELLKDLSRSLREGFRKWAMKVHNHSWSKR